MTVSLKNRVGIIVVTYNNERDLPPLADSLSRAIHKEYVKKIVFVDSGSQDQTLSLISSLFPEAAVIQSDNKGYGAGLNTGIAYFKKDLPHFFFFLNADIEIPPHCFNNLLEEFIKNDHPSFPIGIMGPRILAPTPRGWAEENLRKRSLWGIPQGKPKKGYLYSVHSTHGACLLVKREVIEKVGYFDEDYFMYWEEVDYCTRARKKGFKIVVVGSLYIYHHPREIRNNQNINFIFHLLWKNQVLFAKKNYGLLKGTLFCLLRFPILVKEFIKAALKNE
ncbi:glycosyltransferase family 2 protein [Candidatus Methylacidiphilum infernorum]|uniref:Glycosyltransferase family 2 protein n=1 Tax=Candidatus Methylacidiphilum infernorum TaxID=511746 RepID=A0ABX7PUI6_9BACT|nr:glycosyltransferase family 2 protein [Candidatus Methylacidiphilum infernorum]QSR86414.1 glycosyltransferase family 2 protein [Candidatus Methylacidiphilum infernorum]